MDTKTETAVAATAPKGAKTITLPASGKVAVVRKGKGKDLRIAGRHANPAQDPLGFGMALAALMTTIDGNPVLPEELDEMDLDDVQAIMGAMPGKFQPPGTPSL